MFWPQNLRCWDQNTSQIHILRHKKREAKMEFEMDWLTHRTPYEMLSEAGISRERLDGFDAQAVPPTLFEEVRAAAIHTVRAACHRGNGQRLKGYQSTKARG